MKSDHVVSSQSVYKKGEGEQMGSCFPCSDWTGDHPDACEYDDRRSILQLSGRFCTSDAAGRMGRGICKVGDNGRCGW